MIPMNSDNNHFKSFYVLSFFLIFILIGTFIGVAMYSAVKNGIEFFTFFPLIFVFFLLKDGKNFKALENELKSRNLK